MRREEVVERVAAELLQRRASQYQRDHRLDDDARRGHRTDVGTLVDGDGLVTVRPERIRFGAPADDEHGATGIVDAVQYLGATTRYRVHTSEGTDVTVEVANTSRAPGLAVGDTVQLAWHDSDRQRVGPPLADVTATD